MTAARNERPGPVDRTTIVLRPIASPMPLGFLAFAVGTAVTAMSSLGVVPSSDGHQVAVLLLTFTGPLQLLAAVFAFLARDVGAGTAFAVFAGTWVSTGTGQLLAPDGSTSPVTAVFFVALAVVALLLAVSARSGKPALTVLLVLSAARLVVLAVHEATGSSALDRAAGVVGSVIALASLYGALALLLEDAQGRLVLPTGRRGTARDSFEGDLDAQLAGLDSEAGVRNQL